MRDSLDCHECGEGIDNEIEIDGKRLAHHFAGRQGAHPAHLSPLGWSSTTAEHRAKIVAQFLPEEPSRLESGRIPVLVCEECGEVGFGAFAVRVVKESEVIKWTGWTYENGYEPAREMTWPTRPGDMIFERNAYEIELSDSLKTTGSHTLSKLGTHLFTGVSAQFFSCNGCNKRCRTSPDANLFS